MKLTPFWIAWDLGFSKIPFLAQPIQPGFKKWRIRIIQIGVWSIVYNVVHWLHKILRCWMLYSTIRHSYEYWLVRRKIAAHVGKSWAPSIETDRFKRIMQGRTQSRAEKGRHSGSLQNRKYVLCVDCGSWLRQVWEFYSSFCPSLNTRFYAARYITK